MKKALRTSFYAKIFIIIFAVLTVTLAASMYIVGDIDKEIFYSQKGEQLMSIAKTLNLCLEDGGYEELLAKHGAQNASAEEQLAVLNAELQEMVDEIALVAEGMGAGFYSLDLDMIVAYGPTESFGHIVGTHLPADHPAQAVMANNDPKVSAGNMLRGFTISAQYPITRNGEMIGYCFANALTDDMDASLERISSTLTLLLGAIYIVMIGIAIIFSRRMIAAERKSKVEEAAATAEITRLNSLMGIVNNAVVSLFSGDEKTFERVLQNAMQTIAKAFNIDQIFICKAHQEEGELGFEPVARWLEESETEPEYFDIENNGFPQIVFIENWQERLNSNQPARLLVSQLSEIEQKVLAPYNIRSTLFIPIFLQEKFWGMASFTNCHVEQNFSQGEEEILFSASLLMANTIARSERVHQLIIAREDALAGVRSKSAFLATMSHEIRTPMNAIIGMTAIGKGSSGDERKNYAFEKIQDASTHLLGIVNDVLEFSRIESGELELSPSVFVFESMLKRIASAANHCADEKEQDFSYTFDSAIPKELFCDHQRLAQVISNLLSNSMKFTPKHGKITLNAQLVKKEEGICTLQIDVTDTGIGLNEKQKQRIFKPFEQVENTTTRKYGGIGIGLSISKSIIELMGGEIWVASESQKGTTFSFTIQAKYAPAEEETGAQALQDAQAAADEAEAMNAETEQPSADEGLDDFTGKHLLLADDVDINREIVLSLLEPYGLIIDCAENGLEAVRLFSAAPEKYDMIFMDIQMPEMDGYDATRQIRALELPQAASIPIVAMTANAFREDVEKCLAAGMNAHVAKPIDIGDVLGALRTYLK